MTAYEVIEIPSDSPARLIPRLMMRLFDIREYSHADLDEIEGMAWDITPDGFGSATEDELLAALEVAEQTFRVMKRAAAATARLS